MSTLDRALTGVIEHTRSPAAVPARVDLARVVAERCAFWAVLAEDQGRAMDVTVPPSGVLVGAAPATVAACGDALVGNVFAHTPDGSGFSVVLSGPVLTDPSGAGLERVWAFSANGELLCLALVGLSFVSAIATLALHAALAVYYSFDQLPARRRQHLPRVTLSDLFTAASMWAYVVGHHKLWSADAVREDSHRNTPLRTFDQNGTK